MAVIPSPDNILNDITENLITDLKNTTRSEKEFIIFKTYFNKLNNDDISMMEILKKYPLLMDKLLWIFDEANTARECSDIGVCNRKVYFEQIMIIYKELLKKITTLANELNITNSLELSILYSYLLWNGYLSKTYNHIYKENDEQMILGLQFTDVINGFGVCRNYTEMLKDLLNYNGYNSTILTNYCSEKLKINYAMDIGERTLNNVPVLSKTLLLKSRKANHTFNLIEDNGFYIYDPTNLLLYKLKNKNTAELVNGTGENTIYPYQSYMFCYSDNDEKLLDKIFIKDTFLSSYDNTDFVSTSEVNLEILKNSISLLKDFYVEAKHDIVSISEETKKLIKDM